MLESIVPVKIESVTVLRFVATRSQKKVVVHDTNESRLYYFHTPEVSDSKALMKSIERLNKQPIPYQESVIRSWRKNNESLDPNSELAHVGRTIQR